MAIDIRVNGKHYMNELFENNGKDRKINEVLNINLAEEMKDIISSYQYPEYDSDYEECKVVQRVNKLLVEMANGIDTDGHYDLTFDDEQLIIQACNFLDRIEQAVNINKVLNFNENTKVGDFFKHGYIVWDWVSIIYESVLGVDLDKKKYGHIYDCLAKVSPLHDRVCEFDKTLKFGAYLKSAFTEIRSVITTVINSHQVTKYNLIPIALLLDSFAENYRMWIVAQSGGSVD